MISVFFADTVRAKARQTSMMASIILARPFGGVEILQALSVYSKLHTTRQT